MGDSNGAAPVHETVMTATADALAEHGFAGVTMRDVAERTDVSKSTLHYRYDTKDELLAAFVGHIADRNAERVAVHAGKPPLERLVGMLDENLAALDDPELASLTAAYLEMHARAERNETLRAAIAEADRRFRRRLAETIEDGIESGVFREVDPDAVAALLVAVPDSAALHRATLGQEAAVEQLRTALREVVFESLLADDADVDRGELL
jgi:AcrR family transcriptional regulator